MSGTLLALGIDRMSAAQRVALAHEILGTVVADTAIAAPPTNGQPGHDGPMLSDEEAELMANLPPLTAVDHEELARRAAYNRANPTDVIPWEQVQAEALARCGR